MSTKTGSKAKNKKPLETTLGKAPPASNPVDISHLGKPIETSIFGLKHVLNLYETATDEVRRYVTYECEIMYECRICRTVFRSLANFILHKRNYCQESFRSNHPPNLTESLSQILHDKDLELKKMLATPTPVSSDSKQDTEPSVLDPECKDKKGLDSVVCLLKEKQASALITEQCLNEDVSNESLALEKASESHSDVALQKIRDSNTGVFQTLLNSRSSDISKGNLMKTEVMEIHSILDNNEAILGCDGKIIENGKDKGCDFVCTVCNNRFSTSKTLSYHVKFKHNNSRMVYQCPQCKDIFANAWGVFRHLYKIHHKTTAQVKKLRNQVHSNMIRRDEIPEDKSPSVSRRNSLSFAAQRSLEVENQWLDNFELDNDVQRCGGCGRKFERKAALHSHSQFCSKRIAVCNSIKEAKKVHVEEKHVGKSTDALVNEHDVQGSRRRKPLVANKLYRVDYMSSSSNDNATTTKLTDKVTSDDNNSQFAIIKDFKQFSDPVIEIIDSGDEDFQGFDSKSSVKEETPTNVIIKVEKDCEAKRVDHFPDLIDITSSSSSDSDKSSRDIKMTFDKYHSDTSLSSLEQANKRQGESLLNENTKKARVIDLTDDCNEMEKASSLMLETTSTDYINLDKLSCLPCNESFAKKQLLLSHMAKHFTWFRYQCMKCSYKSYDKLVCEEHVSVEHNVDDVARIQSIVQPVPIFKALTTCSSFISLVNETVKIEVIKKEDSFEEVKEAAITNGNEHLVPTAEEATNGVDSKSSSQDETASQNEQQDPLMNMIMEVIFGGSNDPPSEELTNEKGTHKSNGAIKPDSKLPKKVESSTKLSKKFNNGTKKPKPKQPKKVKSPETAKPITEVPGTELAPPTKPCALIEITETEQPPANNCDLKENQDETEATNFQVETSSSPEELVKSEAPVAADSTKSPESKTTPPRDTARPIRNRVVPIQKDFLYDMRTLLKQKLVKDNVSSSSGSVPTKSIPKKPKTVKNYVSKVKEKSVEPPNVTELDLCDSTLDVTNVKDEVNIEEDVNMNSKLIQHITGD